MKKIKLIIFICAVFFSAALYSSNEYRIESYRFEISHPTPQKAVELISKSAMSNGGYTIFLRNNRIKITVPITAKKAIMTSLRKTGYINDEKIYSSDVSKTVLSLETALKNKKNYISQLYKVFSGSNLTETLEMEKEINKAILDAERIEGQLNRYKKSAGRIVIDVNVSFHSDSGSYGNFTKSQFQWINNLGVDNLYRR